MYCPQCGTSNQAGLTTCHNCGASLTASIDPDERLGRPSRKDRVIATVMLIDSLVLGLLSCWSYAYLVFRYYLPTSLQTQFLHTALNFAMLAGLPLGLTGMVLAGLAWRRLPKDSLTVVMAGNGILFCMGGIAGHVWFITSCGFCQ